MFNAGFPLPFILQEACKAAAIQALELRTTPPIDRAKELMKQKLNTIFLGGFICFEIYKALYNYQNLTIDRLIFYFFEFSMFLGMLAIDAIPER